ncbi:Cyclin, N-terminal [Dillenia turbinata]|uniref:Cyclin, N-terminal n=1 Tax=Dillenia turbinata TaxID=194707 RepID=A0AAN8VUI1_9MAGN
MGIRSRRCGTRVYAQEYISGVRVLSSYIKKSVSGWGMVLVNRCLSLDEFLLRSIDVRKSMTEYDPRLVVPTCLYLASKAEESTVHARMLVFYSRKIYTDERYKFEIKDILEMEMKILEALDYYLVVFHPYRALPQLLQDAGMGDISMTQLSCR